MSPNNSRYCYLTYYKDFRSAAADVIAAVVRYRVGMFLWKVQIDCEAYSLLDSGRFPAERNPSPPDTKRRQICPREFYTRLGPLVELNF